MATLSWRNASVYVAATSAAAAVQVSEARSLNLSIDRATDDDGALGDTWATQISGRVSWSGSFDSNFDTAQTVLFDAATQVLGPVRFYGYPDRDTTARYYYGFVWIKMSTGGDLDSRGEASVDFDGSGALSAN